MIWCFLELEENLEVTYSNLILQMKKLMDIVDLPKVT